MSGYPGDRRAVGNELHDVINVECEEARYFGNNQKTNYFSLL
ncbi:hypothetical protein [Nostoc sp.]